jgi:hypothetical protein
MKSLEGALGIAGLFLLLIDPQKTGWRILILIFAAVLILDAIRRTDWAKKPAERKVHSIVYLVVILVVLLFGYFTWPSTEEPPSKVRLHFKASPVFTNEHKKQITRTVSAFCRYLDVLGFDSPKEFPPLEVTPGSTVAWIRDTGQPIYGEKIILGEQNIDHPEKVRDAIAGYIFDGFFQTGEPHLDDQQRLFRDNAAHILSRYYVHSFEGNPRTHGKWNDAVWEVRQEYGKDFTDNALFYAFKAWDDQSVSSEDSFDRFFSGRFRWGVHVADNRYERSRRILEILEAHGLPVD